MRKENIIKLIKFEIETLEEEITELYKNIIYEESDNNLVLSYISELRANNNSLNILKRILLKVE